MVYLRTQPLISHGIKGASEPSKAVVFCFLTVSSSVYSFFFFHLYFCLVRITMVQLSILANLAVLSAWASAKPMDYYGGLHPVSRANIGPQQVAKELGPLLSTQASIFGPNDTQWDAANINWDEYGAPNFNVVVQAGQEDDVPIIVSELCRPSSITSAADVLIQIKPRSNMPIAMASTSMLGIEDTA